MIALITRSGGVWFFQPPQILCFSGLPQVSWSLRGPDASGPSCPKLSPYWLGILVATRRNLVIASIIQFAGERFLIAWTSCWTSCCGYLRWGEILGRVFIQKQKKKTPKKYCKFFFTMSRFCIFGVTLQNRPIALMTSLRSGASALGSPAGPRSPWISYARWGG